ncbi:MAG: FAD-dependent oxidoreductase [Polyangiaceae bacterium]|jgi:ferredoxin-NADP reductase|nr:FAD-dependent oxidoreductase [Polyangiaceae bacterium]
MPLPPTFPVRLLAARALTPSVRELLFEREDGPLSFDAGQWVSLALPVEPAPAAPLRRSYSIASAPDGSGRFELAVTRVEGGPGSTLLHGLEPGAVLQATGPQGFFTREPGQPSLFVGTGTGVTPLRSMIVQALRAGAQEPMTLLLGVRHEEDLLYREEWEELQRKHPNFSFHATLSRGAPSWAGLRGYVQEHVPLLWSALASAGEPHLYVCGLDRMVKVVRDLLRKQLDVPRGRVHSERFD